MGNLRAENPILISFSPRLLTRGSRVGCLRKLLNTLVRFKVPAQTVDAILYPRWKDDSSSVDCCCCRDESAPTGGPLLTARLTGLGRAAVMETTRAATRLRRSVPPKPLEPIRCQRRVARC